MHIERVKGAIYHINYDSREKLCSAFLRFQEYYESPEFKGKIFTLDEYKQWYIKNSPQGKKTGIFTYYEDWSGFNVPSKVFLPFVYGRFDPLTIREKELLNSVKKIKEEKFYIIGTFGDDNINTYKHEIAHGLFYTNSEYKEKCMDIIKKMSKEDIKLMHTHLASSGGYHPEVYDDETNSYLALDYDYLIDKGVQSETLKETSEILNNIFKEYYNC